MSALRVSGELYAMYHSPEDEIDPTAVPADYFFDVYCPHWDIPVPASAKNLGNGGRARDLVIRLYESYRDTRDINEVLSDEAKMLFALEERLSTADYQVEMDRFRVTSDVRKREKLVRRRARDLRLTTPGLHMAL